MATAFAVLSAGLLRPVCKGHVRTDGHARGVNSGRLGAVVERGGRAVAEAWSEVADPGHPDMSEESGRRPGRFGRRRQSSTEPPTRAQYRRNRRNRGRAILRVLRQLWIPLVIVAVIVAGGFTVSRLHGIFGSEKRTSYADTRAGESKPFNPKRLKYEIFGPPGTVATISYFDANGDPQRIEGVHLPWSLEFPITAAAAIGNVTAQGDGASIGCRITVDNEVKSERVSHEVNAFTFCLLKAA